MTIFLFALCTISVITSLFFWHFTDKHFPNSIFSSLLGVFALLLGAGTIYAMFGTPTYLGSRPYSVETDTIGSKLRPTKIQVLETYGRMVAERNQSKKEWIGIAIELQDANRSQEAAQSLVNAAEYSQEASEQAHLFGAAGEMLVQAKGGRVSDEAVDAFTRSLAAAPDSLGALFFLGKRARSDGNRDQARRYWSRFVRVAPDDHPLKLVVENEMALLSSAQPKSSLAPALTAEMRRSFDGLSAAEQSIQIQAMLDRAEKRILARGSSATEDEWRDLARAYQRTGDIASAIRAYDRALEIAPSNSAIEMERTLLDSQN